MDFGSGGGIRRFSEIWPCAATPVRNVHLAQFPAFTVTQTRSDAYALRANVVPVLGAAKTAAAAASLAWIGEQTRHADCSKPRVNPRRRHGNEAIEGAVAAIAGARARRSEDLRDRAQVRDQRGFEGGMGKVPPRNR